MVHRFLILCALGALLTTGCRSKKTGEPSSQDELSAVSTDGARTPEAPMGSSGDRPGGNGSFGTAFTTLFGIKIPTGMYPARGPERVYRFEGKLPAARTAALIRDQIIAEKEVPEGDGFLFRFAKVKHRRMKTGRHSAVAIRVATAGDGSTLDIWQESVYVDNLPGRSAVADFPMPSSPRQRRIIVNKEQQRRDKESLRTLMSALRKMEQGEPLTPEEAASGVYD